MDTPIPQLTPKSSTNAMMWVVLIILLVIVAVGIYLWWQNDKTNINTNTVVNTTYNTNENTNIVTNTSVSVDPVTGWNVYNNTVQDFVIKYPTDWIASFDQSSDLNGQYIGLTKGNFSKSDPENPWNRIYNDEAYIQIGVSDLTFWDWPDDLGRDFSFEETSFTLKNGSAQQRIAVGYNRGIENGRFSDNSIPQLFSVVIFTNDEQFIWMRLFTGGENREGFLQEFEGIIKTFQLT